MVGLRYQLANSAICYKPFDGPALYMFRTLDMIFIRFCKDALSYRGAVFDQYMMIPAKPVFAVSLNVDDWVGGLSVAGINLGARGKDLYIVVGPQAQNAESVIMAMKTVGCDVGSAEG